MENGEECVMGLFVWNIGVVPASQHSPLGALGHGEDEDEDVDDGKYGQ